ncbi:hypothetical protein BsWGS_15785 [Bradybaena similaris]
MDALLKDLALSIYDSISSVLMQSSDVSEQLYSQQRENSVQNSNFAAVEESSLVSQAEYSLAAPDLTNPEEHLNAADCLPCDNDTLSGKNNRSDMFKEHEKMSENTAAKDSDSPHVEHLCDKPVSSEIQKVLTSPGGAIVVYILETEIPSPSMRIPSCTAAEASSVSQAGYTATAAGLANLDKDVHVTDCPSCENDGLSDKNNGSDNMVKEDEKLYENTTAIDSGSLQKGYLCSEPVSSSIQEVCASPDVAIAVDALEKEISIPSLRHPEKLVNTQLIKNKRSSDKSLSSAIDNDSLRTHEDLPISKALTKGFIDESIVVTRTTGKDKIIQSPLNSGTPSTPTRQEIENDFQIECTNEASDLAEVLVSAKEICVNVCGDCSHLEAEPQSETFPETGVPEKQLFSVDDDGDGRCQAVNGSGDCSHLEAEPRFHFPETGFPVKQLFSVDDDGDERCQAVNGSGDCSHLEAEPRFHFPETGFPEKQLFSVDDDGDGRCQTVNGSGDCSHLEAEPQSPAFPETGFPEKQLFSVGDDCRFTTVKAGALEFVGADKIQVAEENLEPRRKLRGLRPSRICGVASCCSNKQNDRPSKARSSNNDDNFGSSVLDLFKSPTDMAVTTRFPKLKSHLDTSVTTSLSPLKHVLFHDNISENKSNGQKTITELGPTSNKKSKEFHKVTKKDDTWSVIPRKKRKCAAMGFTNNFANASREIAENEKIVTRSNQHFSKLKSQKAESIKSDLKSANKSYSLRSTLKFKMHMLPSAKRSYNLRDIKSGKDKSWLCKSNKLKISERIVPVRRSNRLAQTIRKSWKDHELSSGKCNLCMAHTQTMTKTTQAGCTKDHKKTNHIINNGMENQTVSTRAMSKHRHTGTTENPGKKINIIDSRKNQTLMISEGKKTSRKATSVGVANKKLRTSNQPCSTMARNYEAPDKRNPTSHATNIPEYTVGNPMIVLHEISLNSPQGVAGFISSLSSLGLPNLTADVSTGNSNETPSPQVVQALKKYGYSIDDGWLVIRTV